MLKCLNQCFAGKSNSKHTLMHSGTIRRILKVKKKKLNKKLMVLENNSLNDKSLEMNVAISRKKLSVSMQFIADK